MNEIQAFEEWVREHAFAERALQRFWAFFATYQAEHETVLRQRFIDFTETLLVATLDQIILRGNHWHEEEQYEVYVSISLYYNNKFYVHKGVKKEFKDGKLRKEYFGTYRLYFSFDGEF